jgi:type IV pilus assembly protein PilQ
VEATSTQNLDLGINWGFSYDNQGTSTWGSPQFVDTGLGGNFIIPPFAPATGQAAGLGTDMLFGRVGIDSVTLSLRLSALETSGHGKIISNPRVTTLNGEKARITQGTKIPYQTVSETEIKTELVEAALSLEVLPVINPDNSVILTIKATNSSPGTTVATGAGAAPSIDTKEAETKMILKDGETTVIGGIFIDREDYSENGVPLIMRLPILGHLFKSTKNNKNRSELLIFITPRIIQ